MKTLLKTSLIAPFILASGMAHAATDFGLLGDGDSFSSGAVSSAAGASFSDDYTFQLGSFLNVDGLLENWLSQDTTTIRTDNMTVDFYKDMGGSWTLLGHWDVAAGGSVDYNANLNAGSYLITVAGDATGTDGGTYVVNGTVSAVPEPSTYALMLGGLGLVGFMAARKKKIV